MCRYGPVFSDAARAPRGGVEAEPHAEEQHDDQVHHPFDPRLPRWEPLTGLEQLTP